MEWFDIWSKRIESDEPDVILKLIRADGFDLGSGAVNRNAWEDYVRHVMLKLNMEDHQSVFEVGCGAGAFLLPISERGLWVSGCDYSAPLIDMARKYINDSFYVATAEQISPQPQYDHVIANSTFQYFPSLEYARMVVATMIEKSHRTIAVLDINDKSQEKLAQSLRSSRMNDYDTKYRELEHLFIDKDWWRNIAREFNCEISIEDQYLKDYGNSVFRYNVFLTKNKDDTPHRSDLNRKTRPLCVQIVPQ